VGIVEVKAVGNYAIRISFDDIHDTGIYSTSSAPARIRCGGGISPIWRQRASAATRIEKFPGL